MDFGIKFDGFRMHFCNKIGKAPKPTGTKRIDGKHQGDTDACRNIHKLNASKNADIKHLIDILLFAERKQPQQTPSFKIGGGGARAARRIRID